LFAERTRTPTNIALLGPASLRLKSPAYWNILLEEGGFSHSTSVNLYDLVYCIRADRQVDSRASQLTLDL